MLRLEDLTEENLEDVFKICSHGRMEDHLQKQGITLKRQWLLDMLQEYGSCTKIAYLDGKPIGQILHYPESADPTFETPRKWVMVIHCTYIPFSQYHGIGAGSMLVRGLIDEFKRGPRSLKGDRCTFISAQAFNTGEGQALGTFYERHGFQQGIDEMYLEIHGEYQPKHVRAYRPLPGDKGRAVLFYEPMCEWSIGFAIRAKKFLKGLAPDLPVTLINNWEEPGEYLKRGGQQMVVNATPITSFWTDKEALTREVKKALNNP
ncbi:MAG: hypothetical protein PVJ38_05345 [Candidatus Bathyarchaeota archaeon]|jgi:hypothetical protein